MRRCIELTSCVHAAHPLSLEEMAKATWHLPGNVEVHPNRHSGSLLTPMETQED